MLLLIIASAETLIDKSLQGLQARLNDRLYKKQGHGGQWKMSVLITLHVAFVETFNGAVCQYSGGFFTAYLLSMCILYVSNNLIHYSL